MRVILSLITLSLILGSSKYQAPEKSYAEIHKPFLSVSCIDKVNQEEMDTCTQNAITFLKKEMQIDLNHLIESSEDKKYIKLLRNSQAYWEDYVETNCKIETYESKDGSGYFSIFNACLETQIIERISYLRWLKTNI
ncbi:lysozyme inhibitor LprI family protein [Agarivorans gilvus]|uniref:Lysozyme inhibitor LprI-like N-terminal domain-containing protein n=1 Tax=Agarivorans gilvus TaxID=680279 RepID=A0ABQ1HZ51_9ALTE|nr:lysozyme inhibitor LprI family protein [Agarivorans gilvus]GGB00991.1 hypothetical protein GCM10007414_12670 [Agarivorans gilvus]